MSTIHCLAAGAVAAFGLVAPASASADCKLLQLAEFKLDPASYAPIVEGSINGHPEKALIDSGASFSMISYAEAKKLGLPAVEAAGSRAYGIGGSRQMYWAHIDHLSIGDLSKASLDLAVVGDRHDTSDVGIVIGDDVLSKADIEFDLAHNAIRLFEPKGCAAAQLVYWGAAYSQVALLPWERDDPAIHAMAALNGKPLLAELDSGAETSLVDTTAAANHGVSRTGADAAPGPVRGAGPKLEQSWVGHFDSFTLGDEKIGHVSVQVADVMRGMTYTEAGSYIPRQIGNAPSMFIGQDFLHAHRVFVDNQDHLILFSYQGGPVFSTAAPKAAASR